MLLKLENPYMRGMAVRRWQETCNALGVKVVTDGVFGPKTEEATKKVQALLGVTVDGIVGDKTWAAAEARIAQSWTEYEVDGVKIVDCRKVFRSPKNHTRNREGKEIQGIVLHRTSCVLGENPKRWESVNCHVGVTLSGKIILMHDFTKMIWHGNGPSPFTVGIEFDGNPEGFPGKWWKPGGGPHPITPEQEKAADVLFSLMKQEIEKIGGKMERIIAHRQSSEDREYDPGWECWKKIAIPWQKRIGIESDPNKTWGTGKPIPEEWK